MDCLKKEKEELLAFYDFPADHWLHLSLPQCGLEPRKVKTVVQRKQHGLWFASLFNLLRSDGLKLEGQLLLLVVNNVEFKDGYKLVSNLTERPS